MRATYALVFLALHVFPTLGTAAEIQGVVETKTTKLTLLEKTPGAALQRKIEQMYRAASAISIKYRPLESGELIYFTKEFPQDHWQFAITLTCDYRCDGMGAALRRHLSSGLLVSGSCPPPFSMTIEFNNEDQRSVERIYVHGHGQCFSVGDDSYALYPQNSLLKLLGNTFGVLE